MWTARFEVTTGGAPRILDITPRISEAISGLGDGILHVFLPHATAGLALIEVGSGSDADLRAVIDRLLPPSDVYAHSHGSEGHGRDHVLPALIAPFLVLAVRRGRLDLGTWQSVVVIDTNRDNPVRTVMLSFVEG